MQKLKLALDWTPNINHIGFFVAQSKGFYQEVELDVEISDPSQDNYQTTPAKKVELGMVDFALCPTESVISYNTKSDPFKLIAIAALLKEDLSAIVVRSDIGIDSPKDLDGKLYSSYQARYEDGIVKEMIKNDGGEGDLRIVYPEKLSIWDTLLNNEADATWIFMNWEGVEVANTSHDLKYFKMKDYQIPYSYSPVLAADAEKADANLDVYKSFIQATKKGFLFCQSDPEEAVEILSKHVQEKEKHLDLSAALKVTAPHFGDDNNWGIIEEENLNEFLSWIKSKGLERSNITASDLATDKCLH